MKEHNMIEEEERERPRWGGADSSLSLVGEARAAGAKTAEDVQAYMLEKHSTVLARKAITKLLKAAEREGPEFEAYCVILARETARRIVG
jgi:hypothetical protein